MKTFMIWLEHTNKMRRIIHNFMTTLGDRPDALDKQSININVVDKSRLQLAINSLGVTDEAKERLKLYATQHDGQSLSNLLDQIKDEDIILQDNSESKPAVLPPGTQAAPKPVNPQQIQPQQEF